MIGHFRSWFEKQLQPQPDGTWLARPYGWLGGVYALDAATRERYLRFQSEATFWGLLIALPPALLVGIGPLFEWFPYVLGGIIVLVNVQYYLLWRALRGARKVAKERWAGRAVSHPAGLAAAMVPRRLCRIFMVVSGLFAAVGVLAIATDGPSAPMVLTTLFFSGCAYFYWWLARRRA